MFVLSAVSSMWCSRVGAAGVHVDGDQGLGRVDDDVAAALELDDGREHRVELMLHAILGEDRLRLAIGNDILRMAGMSMRMKSRASWKPSSPAT